MRGGDEQAARLALGVGGVELLDGDAEAARVAADLVQGRHAEIAVEGGVLDALGGDGRRGLLEAGDELAAVLEQVGAQVLRQGGEGVVVGRRGLAVLEVGPVDRQCGQRVRQRLLGEGRRQPVQPGDLAGEGGRRLLDLRLERDGLEVAVVAGQLRPHAGQRVLGALVDEDRLGVVEELVADGAVHRPVAQRLAGVEDLLDPDPRGAGVAQALEVLRGVGEAVRVVDADAVDDAVAQQLERLAVGELEDLRVLLADGGEVVDVEEAPVEVRVGLEVEHLAVGPPPVLVARAHVVGDDVEDQRHLGGEPAQLLLPAEGLADLRGVHDVVAVGRTRARLQRGREVQVADPELA